MCMCIYIFICSCVSTMHASDPNSLSVYTDPDAQDIRISQRQFFKFILYLYRKKYDVHYMIHKNWKYE